MGATALGSEHTVLPGLAVSLGFAQRRKWFPSRGLELMLGTAETLLRGQAGSGRVPLCPLAPPGEALGAGICLALPCSPGTHCCNWLITCQTLVLP